MKKPVMLFFQQILPGDVLKQRAQSNQSDTGGGARDLRVSKPFAPLLLPFFPHPTKQEGATQNEIFWANAQGEIQNTHVELWPPTAARPNETRLSRITSIEAWMVNPERYNLAYQAGEVWFFLLVLDADDHVWAQTYEESHWRSPQASVEVRDYLLKRIAATRQGQSVRGFMNFKTGENYE